MSHATDPPRPTHPPTPARDGPVLPLGPQVPRTGGAVSRWLARALLRLAGWRMAGAFPDLPRLVLIGAPHSSNWDGFWGFTAKVALGLDIRILGKHQLFWWPLGPILRWFGVIAVDRTAAHGVVEQAAAMIRKTDNLWFGLAPEGTRKPVRRWKPGFWKIAKAAGVPILPVYFHYPERIIGVGQLFWPGDDMAADLVRIREWYRPWQGKRRNVY